MQQGKLTSSSSSSSSLMATATLLFLLFSLLAHPSLSLNQEGGFLLQAKSSLFDPGNALSDWRPSDSSPCNWTGVTCSSSSSPLAVTSLDLSYLGLAGAFPSVLCRLPRLSFLSLAYNFFNSSLPSSSLRGCSSLTHLDLSVNVFFGPLPYSLPSLLPKLRYLDLTQNNFSGEIPTSFGRFEALSQLSLVANLLTGAVPPFLSNLTTLRELNLSYNPFSPSPIPPSYGNLTNLRVLWLAGCNLVGPIPASLGRLSALVDLDLSSNSLTGPIPTFFTGLPSIVQIELFGNILSGSFPRGFSNLTELRNFDASSNHISGELPDDIFLAPKLESFHLYENNLTGVIPSTIALSRNLASLRLFTNKLVGPLPEGLCKNSPLSLIDLADNHLSGEIPASICDGGVLEELLLINNLFNGSLPESLGRCRTLTRVRLSNNSLSGEVPHSFWGLPHISLLELSSNSFSGGISPLIAGAANLSTLKISNNQFSGAIPEEIGALSNLYELSAANNHLTGPLPWGLRNLFLLGQLDLHNNTLSGGLLTGVQSWRKLSLLNLADNQFTGSIPAEFGYLPVLNYLDLSGNKLTGKIPEELQNLKLNQFNLSNNQLSGSLPPLFAIPAYRNSFSENPELCQGSPAMCTGFRAQSSNHRAFIWSLRSMLFFAAIVLAMILVCLYLRYRKLKKASSSGFDKSKWTLTSFYKLEFSEHEIFDCIDEDNLIGSGASGKVYKAVLSNGDSVAVKKLTNASSTGVETEVATMGKIRHKNIVKLWCCCNHKDCKLLVYDYMPNGSLGDLLHGSKGGLLDWPMRYKIAVDSAEGLAYLHHDCVPPIVHRDVKSNNILLDEFFAAKIADFGVAKAMGKGSKSMSAITGSCGYIAPEYAYTLRVTEKCDIYSFGIVILELVTGRSPVDPEFGEKDFVRWVRCTVEQKGAVESVIDSKLDMCFKVEICKVLEVGLLCASPLPINRPSMRTVVKLLLDISPEKKMKFSNKASNLSPLKERDV